MALESSDLNDGQILQQTRQVEDARGSIQFNITLPSGRILKSEFMRRDDARAGMRKWLEVVKEQAVADSNAERLERAAKGKRGGKMDIERRPGDDQPLFRAGGARVEEDKPYVPDYVEQRTHAAIDRTESVPKEDLKPISPNQELVDPVDFAIQQRNIYAEKVDALRDAERKFKQWQTIVFALEEVE